MPYKISGTKSETARVIVFKESDWSIESETVISGSGAYEVDELETGNKTVIARSIEGEIVGYGSVSAVSYAPIPGDRGVFAGGTGNKNVMDYIPISTPGNANDFGDLTIGREKLSATSNGGNDRGLFAGGEASSSDTNTIDYITISTTGNATNFGDLVSPEQRQGATSNSYNNRGIFAGGGYISKIYYVNISTLSDASDFGNLRQKRANPGTCSNGVNNRGIFATGWDGSGPSTNIIDYVTISTTGNATDFGEMSDPRSNSDGLSNLTNNRGVIVGGSLQTRIDYVTISTTGNSTYFGALAVGKNYHAAASNGINERGVIGGGNGGDMNSIEYITINTPGNATNFGDLTVARQGLAATSNA